MFTVLGLLFNFITYFQKTMYGANVIIFEGILAFYNATVNSMLDMKVFVDTDADVRLARRLRRYVAQHEARNQKCVVG